MVGYLIEVFWNGQKFASEEVTNYVSNGTRTPKYLS